MIEELVKNDKDFNEGIFKNYVDNVFVKLYTSVMLDELESVKHFLSEECYNNFDNKVKSLKERGLTEMFDELNVASTNIVNVNITDEYYMVDVEIVSKSINYFINSDTGDYVSGNNRSREIKNYTLTFKKKRNYEEQKNIRRCPGCGASIDVNNNGKCSYCGTTYNLDKYDYILYNIK